MSVRVATCALRDVDVEIMHREENMAAPTAEEDKTTDMKKLPAASSTTELFEDAEDGCSALQEEDYVVDFMAKEVGSDVKSLKNVGDILEKLTAQNKLLEEQVSKAIPDDDRLSITI